MVNINELIIKRSFYGYTQGSLTGDSPDNDIFNAVQYIDDNDMTIYCTDEEVEKYLKNKG